MHKGLKTFFLTITLVLAACGADVNNFPKTLRIGVLPDQNQETLEKRYTALLQRIAEKTSLKVELVIPDNYNHLLTLFQENKIHLAYFGGATFVKAHESHQAVPLVMRDVDTRFTTYFIVPASDVSNGLEDYKGKSLSFGSRLSTSGHYMPRFFLAEKGIDPESYFSEVIYSETHDRTALLVKDRKVAIGAANSQVVDRLFRQGKINKAQVRILWETPPYPDYVWATQKTLQEELREKIRWAFLELRKNNETDKIILDTLGTEGFLPARTSDFQALEKVIHLNKTS